MPRSRRWTISAEPGPMRLPDVPYFSQWESASLTPAVIAEGAEALRRDPKWRDSGARDIDEYVEWAVHLCGMACFKMILAARTGRSVPILELARGCTAQGGYVVQPDGAIKGLIYAPFVEYARREHGIAAEIALDLPAAGIAPLIRDGGFFIASVHHAIRWPEQTPPGRGGHLVLVVQADGEHIVFHNPSGHDAASQAYATLPVAAFDRFFAGRGILIRP